MNLKLSKILASALVTGLMAISGHAVAGNAAVSATFPSDDLRCTALYNAFQTALAMNAFSIANSIVKEMEKIHCM